MYMDLIVLHQGVSIKLQISIDNWTQFFGWKGEKGERWLRRRMKGEKATGVVVSPPKHHLSYNTVKLNSTNGMADWDSLIGYLDYIVDPELWVSNADL
jgi:hypothetical protein